MERIRLEMRRQPLHILFGLLLVILISHDAITPETILAAIVLTTVAFLYIKKSKSKTIYKLLEPIERKENLKGLPGKGLIAYLIGVWIVLTFFPRDIAMASIMILALGDSFSRLIGPFGRINHPFNNTKFLEGLIAGAIAATLGAMLFVTPSEAIPAAAIAMILEGLDLKIFKYKIDDNITIPAVAGLIIWLIRIL